MRPAARRSSTSKISPLFPSKPAGPPRPDRWVTAFGHPSRRLELVALDLAAERHRAHSQVGGGFADDAAVADQRFLNQLAFDLPPPSLQGTPAGNWRRC